MKKSQLVDGHLLTLGNGDRFYVCGQYGLHTSQPDPLPLVWLDDDLRCVKAADPAGCMDVVVVTKDGERVWQRPIP